MVRKHDIIILRSKSETSTAFASSVGWFKERHQPAYIDAFGGVGCVLNEDCTIIGSCAMSMMLYGPSVRCASFPK